MALEPIVGPMLDRATCLASGRVDSEDVLRMCDEGTMQLWLAMRNERDVIAVLVTELVEFPGRKVCNLLFCAGEDMHTWAHKLAEIEAWAAGEGCEIVTIQGRAGWGRMFPEYRLAYVTLEREIMQ